MLGGEMGFRTNTGRGGPKGTQKKGGRGEGGVYGENETEHKNGKGKNQTSQGRTGVKRKK